MSPATMERYLRSPGPVERKGDTVRLAHVGADGAVTRWETWTRCPDDMWREVVAVAGAL